MHLQIAALLVSATVVIADPHLLPRQDDSSCQARQGNSFQYCSNAGCFNQQAGFRCCLKGATGTICSPGQECDDSGGCKNGGSGGGNDGSTTSKATTTSYGLPPLSAPLTGSVTTEGITQPTNGNTQSNDTGSSGPKSTTSTTTGSASASTTPASSTSGSTSSPSAGGASTSATPSSGNAAHLNSGSIAWMAMGVLGVLI